MKCQSMIDDSSDREALPNYKARNTCGGAVAGLMWGAKVAVGGCADHTVDTTNKQAKSSGYQVVLRKVPEGKSGLHGNFTLRTDVRKAWLKGERTRGLHTGPRI
jgi:hypothetical protein